MIVRVTSNDGEVREHSDVTYVSMKPSQTHWELTKPDHILVIRGELTREVLVIDV